MTVSEVHWGRIRLMGSLAEAKLSEYDLRRIGSGKSRLPGGSAVELFRGIIASAGGEAPDETFLISPSVLERSMDSSAEPGASFRSDVQVLQFEEVCLPDAEDPDRSHHHRTVFMLVESRTAPITASLLNDLVGSVDGLRRRAENNLQKTRATFAVIRELRQRVEFLPPGSATSGSEKVLR